MCPQYPTSLGASRDPTRDGIPSREAVPPAVPGMAILVAGAPVRLHHRRPDPSPRREPGPVGAENGARQCDPQRLQTHEQLLRRHGLVGARPSARQRRPRDLGQRRLHHPSLPRCDPTRGSGALADRRRLPQRPRQRAGRHHAGPRRISRRSDADHRLDRQKFDARQRASGRRGGDLPGRSASRRHRLHLLPGNRVGC